MLTNTWRQRLEGTHSALRRGALIVGLASCSVVAIATIWGWIFNDPIDVAGPARSAVNRTALVGSYAQDCVTRWLTATASHQQVLHDCWSLRDPIRLPTTPALIVTSPAVSAVTLVSDTGTAQQWSVVITVSERAFEAATPHTAYYRLPIVYSNYGLRASALPARVNGPGAGADAPLGYPTAVADTSPAFVTVSGFITSFLTGAGGLERYVTTSSGLLPAADYRSAQVTKLVANHGTGDHDVPRRGHHRARIGHRQRRHQPIRPAATGLPHRVDRHQRPLERLRPGLCAPARRGRRTDPRNPHRRRAALEQPGTIHHEPRAHCLSDPHRTLLLRLARLVRHRSLRASSEPAYAPPRSPKARAAAGRVRPRHHRRPHPWSPPAVIALTTKGNLT